MRESTTYQYILEEGAIQQARKMLLCLAQIRFGSPGEASETAVRSITDLERLERMCEAVLEVGSWQELLNTP